jgi:hypothetical protein
VAIDFVRAGKHREQKEKMKRNDALLVLVLVFGLGMVVSTLVHLSKRSSSKPELASVQHTATAAISNQAVLYNQDNNQDITH